MNSPTIAKLIIAGVFAVWANTAAADTFLDTFSSVSYGNQDGDQNWATDWNETGDGGGSPSAGDIDIVGGRLHMQADNNRISRGADLSAYSNATLSLDYEIDSFEFYQNEEVYLEIRTGGNGPWTTLDTFSDDDPASGNRSYDISGYLSANTEIRFATSGLSALDEFYVDNLLIYIATGGGSDCSALFPDGASSNDAGGFIQFASNSEVTASPDNVLETTNLIDNSGGGSCGSTPCSASGSVVDTLTGSSFPGGSDVTVGFLDTQGVPPGDYGSITTSSNSTLILSAGTYTLSGDLSIGFAADLVINGPGTVRILVDGAVDFASQSDINNAGDAEQLVIVANGEVDLGLATQATGYIYADGAVDIGSWGTVNGAVTGNSVTLPQWSTINYDGGGLATADFGTLCDDLSALPVPVAEWRMDELAWSGFAGEVTDATGNGNDGTALQTGGGVGTISDGLICRAGTFPDIADSTSYAVDSGLNISSAIGNAGAISLWHRSVDAWSSTGSDKTLWDASADGGDNKYFYLILLSDGRLRFGMEDSSDGDFRIETDSAPAIAADEWANVVVNWDVDAGTQGEIWVNGVRYPVTAVNDTLNGSALGNSLSLYIGDNRSSYNPLGSDRAAAGDIDEVLVFDQVLSGTEIDELYNLQSSGLNLDGSTRVCPASPIAEYHFDASGWNGTAGEVQDSSGNGLDGTAVNAATTADTTPPPARNLNPGTCRYADLDGVDQYVEVPDNDQLDLPDEVTVTAWIHPRSFPGGNGLFTILSKDTNYEFHVNSSGQVNWWWNSSGGTVQQFDSSSSLSTDTWYHIAIVYTDGTQRIYIDGVEDNTASFTGGLATNANPVRVGTDINFVGSRNFDGPIDEVKIFGRALSAAEVQAMYQETHPCATSPVDHFDITHNGSAIYCTPTPVSVAAEDATNTTVTSYTGTITLETDSNIGNWSVVNGNGVLNNGSDNDGEATYTFDSNDNGFVEFLLDHGDTNTTNPLAVDIAVSDGTAVDDDLEGPLSFAASGFTITDSELANPPPDPIPPALDIDAQTAGDAFEVHIAAYGTTPTDPDCGIIESYNGDKNLVLGINYIDPGSGTITPTYTPTPTPFDAGQAEVVVTYKDVGEIQLTVDENTLSGSSNAFVVKPARFNIVLAGNPAATDADGGLFTTSGTPFTVRVESVDVDDDVTPNYGLESAAEGIALSHSLVAPTPGNGGVDGSLTGSLSRDSDGVFDGDYSWDEVGIISLIADVADDDYLGAGPVTSTLPYVGRFYPYAFELSDGDVISANDPFNDFTYLGQPFRVEYTLTAVNEAGTTTRNYGDNSFGKLNVADTGTVSEVTSGARNIAYGATGVDNSRLLDTLTSGGWSAGENTVTAELTIQRGTAPEAPIAGVDIAVMARDSDGVELTPLNRDTDSVAGDDTGLIDALPGNLRFGRLVVPPVYTPEIPVGTTEPVPFEVQYYDGTAFVSNTDDEHSYYLGHTCIDGSISCGAVTITSSANDPVSAGQSTGSNEPTVERPGTPGTLNIELDVETWLRFDWDGAGTYDDNPQTTITFGRYRGHDRIIYWRER